MKQRWKKWIIIPLLMSAFAGVLSSQEDTTRSVYIETDQVDSGESEKYSLYLSSILFSRMDIRLAEYREEAESLLEISLLDSESFQVKLSDGDQIIFEKEYPVDSESHPLEKTVEIFLEDIEQYLGPVPAKIRYVDYFSDPEIQKTLTTLENMDQRMKETDILFFTFGKITSQAFDTGAYDSSSLDIEKEKNGIYTPFPVKMDYYRFKPEESRGYSFGLECAVFKTNRIRSFSQDAVDDEVVSKGIDAVQLAFLAGRVRRFYGKSVYVYFNNQIGLSLTRHADDFTYFQFPFKLTASFGIHLSENWSLGTALSAGMYFSEINAGNGDYIVIGSDFSGYPGIRTEFGSVQLGYSF